MKSIPAIAVGVALVTASMFSVSCNLDAQDHSEVIRGTINVVLGNSNGMVVLTDSMQTLMDWNGQRVGSKEAQKLIRLDDHSVCAVAGFGSGTVSAAPQFAVDVIGIIAEYRDQLAANRETPTFASKLRTISSLVKFHLEAIANLADVLSPSPTPNNLYTFSLFLAGYDSDDSPKIGTLDITARPQQIDSGGYEWSFDDRINLFPVGKEFEYGLGGMRDAAQMVLAHPEGYPASTAVKRYQEAMQKDHGASLTLEELRGLAEFLATVSSLQHPLEIGGANQLCIFRDGKIETLTMPSFPEPPRPFRFNLIERSSFNSGLVLVKRTLFVRCIVANDPWLSLDDNYFVDTEIRNSVVEYDGGVTLFDKTNRAVNSRLALGPHVDPKSSRVRAIINNFQWVNQAELQKQE